MPPGALRLWPISLAFLALVAADAVGTAFLPVHARGLAVLWPGLGPAAAASLPVACFWLAVAAAQLTVPRWLPEREHDGLMRAALSAVSLALAASAVAPWAELLIVCRMVAGFGYGVAMILAQDTLLRAYPASARTQASAFYLSLFFGGSVTGTVAGGLLASAIGAGPTLAVGAGLAAVALVPVAWMPSFREARRPPGNLAPLLRNPGFIGLVGLAAIPSRLLIGAFLYYLLPLYLHDQGVGSGQAGWVLMVYGVTLAALATPLGRMIDRRGQPFTFTLLGLIGSGAALAALLLGGGGIGAAVTAVALLGLAQALGMAPQVTLLFAATQREMAQAGRARLLGLFRVGERFGLFLGPLLAGGLLPWAGYAGTLQALTIFILLAAGGFAALYAASRKPAVETEA